MQYLDEIAERFYNVQRRNGMQGMLGDFMKVLLLLGLFATGYPFYVVTSAHFSRILINGFQILVLLQMFTMDS